MKFRYLPLVTLTLALFAVPALAQETKGELWYDFKFHGAKVGFLQALDEPTTYEGKPAIHSRRHSLITVRRGPDLVRMESDTDSWADLKGRPLHFTHVRNEGGSKRRLEGTVEGSMFVVKTDVGGSLSETKIPLGDDVYLSSNLDYFTKRDLKEGKKISGRAVVEEDGVIQPFTSEVIRVEGKGPTAVFIVKSQIAGIESEDHVQAGGKTLKTSVIRMGAEFSLTTREQAMAILNPTDIFTATHLRTKVRLPKAERLDELTVRLIGRSGHAPRPIIDERQRVVSQTKAEVELRVVADQPPKKAPKLPIKDPKLSRFLGATQYEALKDERISSTSKEIVEGKKDAWEAARAINTFVYSHITKKSLAQAFSTAIEALEAKEGDCTEHAVLFSALAKAAGIPTRLVTGVVYVGGEDGIFGYHEWVEVWMGDRWIAMDPTFGEDLASVTHIKFSQGTSDPDGLRDAGMIAAELFGDLELVVKSYSADGKKTTL